jgi:hypothetical protein
MGKKISGLRPEDSVRRISGYQENEKIFKKKCPPEAL